MKAAVCYEPGNLSSLKILTSTHHNWTNSLLPVFHLNRLMRR